MQAESPSFFVIYPKASLKQAKALYATFGITPCEYGRPSVRWRWWKLTVPGTEGSIPMTHLNSKRTRLGVTLLTITLAGMSLLSWNWLGIASGAPHTSAVPPDGWTAAAPRDEIRPDSPTTARAGRTGTDALSSRPTTVKVSTVAGENFPHHGRQVLPLRDEVFSERRGRAAAKRRGRDSLAGRKRGKVPLDKQMVTEYLRGYIADAETEFPTTQETDQ